MGGVSKERIIKFYSDSGIEEYNTSEHPVTDWVTRGISFTMGDVMHRIRHNMQSDEVARMAAALCSEFMVYIDNRVWTAALGLAQQALTNGELIQIDYDAIESAIQGVAE